MNGSLPLPPVLSTKLSDYRRTVRVVKLAEGILAAVFGLAVSYLLVLGLDRFFDTPAWLRGIFLALGAAVPGLGLPLKWHKWVWRQRRLEDAARLLRWKFPRLGDQLLGIVELAKQDASVSGRSERLVQAAMAQADEAVKDQDFSQAVPKATHRQWAWAAAGSTAVIVAGFVTINEAARNAFLRWVMPWRETERYTFARIEKLPDPLVVPLGESFNLPVNLAGKSQWKPEAATGSIPGQPEVQGTLKNASYALAFPPQKKDAEIFVKVGDVRETIKVEPRPRPELTGLQVKVKLPDYLQYKTEPVLDVRGDRVSVLQGSTATFVATASRELVRGDIDGNAISVEEGRLVSPAMPMQAAWDLKFNWTDTLGLTARVPLALKVQPAGDEAPRIVARRETQEQVVLDSEVVVFEVSASDDFGVKQVGLEWKGMSDGTDATASTIKGTKIAAAGAPETKQVESRATFCASREGVAPQTLEIRAWAEDYLPGRAPVRGASFVIHVLNKTDHALWVTQQMGKWLEAAKETYEREQQLHVTNQELRAMSAEELDRPENRRKVAQQAAAENSNAERLNSLNQSGRNLVEQATKNPEFDAPRLESWATMLKSLQNIAGNRMPSVAGLLKQSADAKADGKLAQNSKGGQPSQNSGAKPGSSQSGQPGNEQKPSEGKPSENATAQNNQNSQNPDGKQGLPGEEQKPQEGKPGENNTAQNNQSNASPSGKPGSSSAGKSAPQLTAGATPPKGSGASNPQDPNAKPKEPAPSIKLTESTMNKPEAQGEQKPGAPKPPGAGKLGLPTNSLAGAPGKKPAGEEEQPPAESSAQKPLEQSVQEQKELLEEFAKVSDQLNEILGSLEASTFVKRLKAASREQTQLASGIGQKTLDAFGITREQTGNSLTTLKEAPAEPSPMEKSVAGFVDRLFGGGKPEVKEATAPEAVAKTDEPKKDVPKAKDAPFVTTYAPLASTKAKSQSEVVKIIQSDLEAYALRKQDQHFKKVLGEMKQTRVAQELTRVGEKAADNYSGNAIHGAEFWADTMDRWAEEMVKAAGKCSNCSSCSGDSLPPEIVLKVMQALRDEMKLRDETRELDKAKPAIEKEEFVSRAVKLSNEQGRIATHTEETIRDIVAIPDGSQKFGKELKLLSAVTEVMAEATDILSSPDVGGPAVAAETEAIELLLQTKRSNPKGGGGGGGGNPGGGGTAASASSAALADIGPGGDVDGNVSARPVGQSTGRAGKEYPEEFRAGLDAYFSNLEGTGGKQ